MITPYVLYTPEENLTPLEKFVKNYNVVSAGQRGYGKTLQALSYNFTYWFGEKQSIELIQKYLKQTLGE